jgi:two-component system sensor kinase FixL
MSADSGRSAVNSRSQTAPEWDALLDAAVDAIIVIDHTGRIETFNAAAEDIFAYSASEILGRNVSVLMPQPFQREHDSYIHNYINTGDAKIIGLGREIEGKRQDGEIFPIGLSVGRIKMDGPPKFVGIIRDITDRKQSEEEIHHIRERLSQFGRLSTLGEMAAGLAHELNQPLTAIATYTQACQRLIESGNSDDAEILAALKKCDAQAQRAGDVIRRLRQFVQKRGQGRQEASCEELIHDIAALAEIDARTHRIQLKFDIEKDLPNIMVDTVQVQQVILNLIRNGIDAMVDTNDKNEAVSVSVKRHDDERIEIAVTDHGSGITAEAEKKIFQPFFTTKPSGLGLGLAICQSIITSHGGVLSFTKNPSGGTTFHFTLPTILEA